MNNALDFAGKARATNVFNQIQAAGFKPAKAQEVVTELSGKWTTELGMSVVSRKAIFDEVANKLRAVGQSNADLIRAVTPWATPAAAPNPPAALPRFGVTPARQRFAPPPRNLADDLINLNLGGQDAAPAAREP